MRKQHTETFGPLEARASTKAQAKLEVLGLAAAALNRLQRPPLLIRGPGERSLILSASLAGWDTHWTDSDSGCSSSSTFDRSLVILSAVTELGSQELDGTLESLSKVLVWLDSLSFPAEVLSAIQTHKKGIDAELRRKNAFTAAYKALAKAGHSPGEAHRLALGWNS